MHIGHSSALASDCCADVQEQCHLNWDNYEAKKSIQDKGDMLLITTMDNLANLLN